MQFICIVLEWNWFFSPGWLPWIGHSPKEVLWSFNFLLLSDLGAIAQSCCFYHCLLSSSNGKWALKVITHHIFFYSAGLIKKKKTYQSFISSHLLSISPTFFTSLPWFSLCYGSQPRPASCWIKLQPRQNQRAHLPQSSLRRSPLVRWTLQLC